jgi:hypothetical protein
VCGHMRTLVSHVCSCQQTHATCYVSRLNPPPPVSCCLCVAGCSYPLTFCPSGAGTYTGSLELVLNSTGEKLAYSLAGKASEPLAEGHVLVECQVRAWMCVVFLGVLS